ncbi:protein phosphatase 1 regulatory subunit 12B isoform X4 [Hippopotamus amphibius kiboko]|uniref:protein phosphatase 1 regulatory subunit 12B isoform X4 n=1 Tax=Hippopotamus amphibius kiboko TaxID=575201 RepID=UPI0025962BCC|nr:protein phosphatase 1 regulatory subunit 12B isoform X4 [Hippopotamus amphibius kiboko]
MAELEHLGGKRAESARARRADQLRRWRGSLTEQEPAERPGAGRPPQARRGGPRVRFEDGAVFLAACSSGDADEVRRLLARGADVDTATVDGLTALHQACIDENLDMVKFLVENGANVNQQDNEGWTPLHAAASCGYLNIAEYFINHGASVAAVNSEGDVPSDLAEEPAVKDLLLEHVEKQGVDLAQARKAEEQQMLQDARQWLNSGKIGDVRQARSGATALHVAAAKGYSEVLRLLIQAGCELNVQDHDGWTALHAAAHWGVKEACSILAEALCDMDVRNKLGQTPFDVADEGLVEHLETLQKKQSVLRSERETRNKLIESDLNSTLHSGLFQNKEKMLYEEETPTSRGVEEENKEPSSSSSDEDGGRDEASESEPEKEAGDAETLRPQRVGGPCSSEDEKPGAVVHHSNSESRSRVTEQTPAPAQNTFSTSSARRERENRSYFSSLGSRRLSSASDLEEKENRESAANLVRSGPHARQPWRDGAAGSEPPQTAAASTYVSTYLKRTPYRSQADSTAERTADSASCSTPLCVITNRPPPGTANGVTAATLLSTAGTDSSVEARDRRRSYLTPVRDEEAESLRKARSRQARQTRRSTQGVALTDLQEAERTFSRSRAERQAQEQPSPKPSGPGGLNDGAQKREPLAAPAEDAGESRPPWTRSLEEEPVYRRLRCPAQPDKPTTPVSPPAPRPSLYTSSYLLRTGRSAASDLESSEPPTSAAGAKEMDRNEGEEADPGDQSSNRLSVRERRRPKERRRGTGINFWTKDEDETDVSEEVKAAWRPETTYTRRRRHGGPRLEREFHGESQLVARAVPARCPPGWLQHERLSRLESGGGDVSSERASARARREAREARLATLSSRPEEDSSRDYRKLYESALTENQKLKTKLQEAQLELADVKSKLEKVAQQKQDKTPDRSSVLETEKRERRALERKMSEMEEEMKVLTELKSDNQRLKDENGALIRVISKLSK